MVRYDNKTENKLATPKLNALNNISYLKYEKSVLFISEFTHETINYVSLLSYYPTRYVHLNQRVNVVKWLVQTFSKQKCNALMLNFKLQTVLLRPVAINTVI